MKRSMIMLAVVLMTMALAWAAHGPKTVQHPPAASKSWVFIGTTLANHTADHDGIVVKGPFDNFRRIRFKVTNAPLNMQHMVVTHDNGEPDKIDVLQNIPQGGKSREIDLKGIGKRSVRRIDFWYDTKGFLKGQADVVVFRKK